MDLRTRLHVGKEQLKRLAINTRYRLLTPARAAWLKRHGRSKLCPRLELFGRQVYSQNDEDGVLAYLLDFIGPAAAPASSFFVEIGAGPAITPAGPRYELGIEANCRLLRERGHRGLILDGGNYPRALGIEHAFVTAENINDLLGEHGVPTDLDLFSLDIDGNEYWVWRALTFAPRIVVIEYNATIAASESKTIVYDPHFSWTANGCTRYYGASLRALASLGSEKGYTLVYANGVNAFFLRCELVPNRGDFVFNKLYRGRRYHRPLTGREVWVAV